MKAILKVHREIKDPWNKSADNLVTSGGKVFLWEKLPSMISVQYTFGMTKVTCYSEKTFSMLEIRLFKIDCNEASSHL